ncbi:phytanoyl-CoA dioxygenase family protein [Chitinophaga pinensis]|uniref:Phytanoyl-CoA dioxygenase family protein n=1 Tax=Chitinophaga pinensis TaxID=79329 RepID=A0A5C6LXX4_9BACT|nr:phytanoyl-CoA dioxygenase family protein [Chitinophaga pinensis]TWW01652.1 phytanoyl-CoA dioxygenase family protein [Chitinophaga pinensis]
MNAALHQQEIAERGFTVIDGIFTSGEVATLLSCIQQADTSNDTFRKTKDLFAIRQFLKEIPGVVPAVFTDKLKEVISRLFGEGYYPVKSIYFDKPGDSNWFVSYHQDLTISVKEKADVNGFGPWTVKQQQYAVQPPLHILEQNFTIRIHLDNTDGQNGALRVVPGSHKKGIYRPETIDWTTETETTCDVPEGGIMIMRPLLLHASSRTTNDHKRRVIHIEFSDQSLPAPLQWSELLQ